jgi:tetratricopeptide (TPR) repeat protein
MGDSKRAVHLHERAIAVHSGHLSKYDRERAFHGSRLAYACYQEKQYERALSVLDDIEIVFKARIPDDYRALAQVLHTRGSVYQALGDHEQALDYLKKALNMRESWLSKDHPAVARTCYQLALLYKERGEYRLAFEYAERALRIQELKLPKTHQERKWSQQVVERLKCHIDSLSFCQ